MKKLILIASFISVSAFANDTYVHGYTKSNGTYVEPHYRTHQDSNPYNNYSTQGNTNPYTEKEGTVDPYKSYQPKPYGSTSNYYGNGQ